LLCFVHEGLTSDNKRMSMQIGTIYEGRNL